MTSVKILKRSRKRCRGNHDYSHFDISPSLGEIVDPIPRTEREYLPGDMEDAYGSGLDHIMAMNTPKLIRLPRRLLVSAGIGSVEGVDALLYIRSCCLTQIVFMCRDVLEHGFIGHILGPPGTGKSSTALFVAARLAIEKRCYVLWAHLNVGIPDHCWNWMYIKPDRCVSLGPVTDSELAELLEEFGEEQEDTSEYHIVILDGIAFDVDISTVPARSWYYANRSKRRLILISSDGADRNLSGRERDQNDVRIFRQWSWDYESYESASSIPEIWNHVESVLDSPEAPDVPEHLSKPERRLWNKYYFAGGNARWMFQYSTKRVRGDIDRAISKGFRSGDVDQNIVPTLFGRFRLHKSGIVSEYTRRMMLGSIGTVELKALQYHPIIYQSDYVLREQLFQLYVFTEALKRTARGEALVARTRAGTHKSFEFESVARKPIQVLSRTDCLPMTLIWTYSACKNTFDGFYIDRGDVVVFLQVTVAERRSVNLLDLRQMMQRLQLEQCEFCFLIPMTMITRFEIGPILNRDELEQFGWPTDYEGIRNLIKVYGVDGWELE